MEYQGSKAFAPDFGYTSRGTQTFIDGVRIEEVSYISVGRVLFIRANYIPESEGHKRVLRAILSLRHTTIGIQMQESTMLYYRGQIDGEIVFDPNKQVEISFTMDIAAEEDPANDGPEIDIIQRESDIRFEKLLRNYFRSERAYRHTYLERAGGFTIVSEPSNSIGE